MEWQLELLTWIQSFKTPILDAFFLVVTASAEEFFFIAAAAWFMWCQNKQLAQRVGFAFLTSTVFNPTLKELFAVERPIGAYGIESMRVETAPGYSFPSGHTQSATSFWFAAALGIKANWIRILAVVMISLVAFSRLYLGVHWFTDVIAGVFFGLLWVFAIDRFYSYCVKNNKLSLLWLVLLPFTIAYLLYPENKPLIVSFGASIGFLAGIQLEHRFIQFNVQGALWKKLVRFAIGLLILLLIKSGLKPILPFNEALNDLIRYTCIGLWITAGAPWLFQHIKPLND
ncbi:phosphatase PAP2 family protein [Reinekea marina]|uniref:undecaprenyl-diphosphate phosphatase n=1 Tax=Reinekea marina TaxID=1310421 RepID=A0ABV7WPL6_9GAMM|nr:phosphatase PAP2 family protein [Reinekea marina]MDN3647808.1 phosphatase PAP2 family protein [Reinekea marina]